jgi:hypothetical protein
MCRKVAAHSRSSPPICAILAVCMLVCFLHLVLCVIHLHSPIILVYYMSSKEQTATTARNSEETVGFGSGGAECSLLRPCTGSVAILSNNINRRLFRAGARCAILPSPRAREVVVVLFGSEDGLARHFLLVPSFLPHRRVRWYFMPDSKPQASFWHCAVQPFHNTYEVFITHTIIIGGIIMGKSLYASSPSPSNGSSASSDLRRTTVFVSSTLDENWRAVALRNGESKTAVFAKALSQYIKGQDLDPTKKPTIKVEVQYAK